MSSKIPDEIQRKPSYREIYVGSEVEVLNRDGLKMGFARLIQRCPSKTTTDNLPYVMQELDDSERKDNDKKRDKYAHIWSYERWMVEWLRHGYYPAGHRSCTEINYYIHTRINHDSKYEFSGYNNPQPHNNNKYIFIEEEGVLVTPTVRYPKPAIRAINKSHKVFGGEVVMYARNQTDTRKLCEKSGLAPRILTFLNTTTSFEESIAEYVEEFDSKDFLIFTGRSRIEHSRVIRIDMTKGVGLKKDSTPKQQTG